MFSFPISLLGHALPELTLASSERKTLQKKCCPDSMQSYSVFLFAELGRSVLRDLFLLDNSLQTFLDFWLLCIPNLFLITGFLLGQSRISVFPCLFILWVATLSVQSLWLTASPGLSFFYSVGVCLNYHNIFDSKTSTSGLSLLLEL